MKNVFIIVLILFLSVSCSKKEEPLEKEILSDAQYTSELTEEMMKLLDNGSTAFDWIAIFKKNNIEYLENLVPAVAQFKTVADRPRMIMRFGMLTADIAYEKIIGKKNQLIELEQLYQKFIAELNITPFFSNSFDDYITQLSTAEINDTKLIELRAKFNKDKVELMNKAKKLDEDFLVYYTIGFNNEITYMIMNTIAADKTNTIAQKILAPANFGGDYDYPTAKFINELSKTEKYRETALIMKPGIDILLKADYTNKFTREEKRNIIFDSVKKLREDILK